MASSFLVAAACVPSSSAHDFGGNTTPNPPPWTPPDDPCKEMCCDKKGGPPFGGPNQGDPVNTYLGAEHYSVTDLTLSSLYPIALTRRYDSQSTFDTALGYGWSFAFDRRLFEYPDGSVIMRTGCGRREQFTFSGGAYITPRDSTQGTLTANGDGTYAFRYYTGARDVYDADGRLVSEESREGFRHEFLYDSRGKLPLTGTSPFSVDPNQPMIVAYVPRLTRIQERSPDGQLTGFAVDFTYDESTGRLTTAATDDGRELHYTHDDAGSGLTRGNLVQVDGLGDLFYFYKYEDAHDAHNVTWIQYGQDGTPAQNVYDTQDRVTQQTQGATVLTFSYVTPFTQTDVTRKIYDDQGVLLYTNVSHYTFDEAGYLSNEVNPLGDSLKSFYTANKDLDYTEWRKSGNNTVLKSTHYTFDGLGHKLSESTTLDAADGGETITRSWMYDNNWIASEQAVSDADPAKVFRTEYTFFRDVPGGTPVDLQSIKRRNDDGSFATTTYTYCTSADVAAPNSTCPYLRQLKSVDGPRTDVTDVTTYTYYPDTDQSGCFSPPAGTCHRKGALWKTMNALGQVTEITRYDGAGRATRIKDINGVFTDMAYDDRGRLLSRKVRGPNDGVETDDAITSYVHDDRGNTTQITQPDGSYLTYDFDGLDRLTSITDRLGNTTQYVLDSEGNRLREDTYDPSMTLTRTLSRSFTRLNQTWKTKTAAGDATTLAYDVSGNVTSTTDPLNHATTQTYDDLDRLTKTVQDASSGGIMATVKYTYDAANNLRKVIDPKTLTTEYLYDARSNLTELDSPDTGTTHYTYDASGNRLTQVDARGVTSTYTYDSLNRLVQIEYPTSSLDVAYHYDEPDTTTGCSGSYPLGRLTTMQDASGTTSYCYDRRGNVAKKTQVIGSTTLSVSYTYDLADHLVGITYPGRGSAAYGRDSMGRIAALTFSPLIGPTHDILQAVEYAPFGPPTSYEFPSGQALSKTYDQNYWVTDVGGSALELHFQRDSVGNIARLTDSGGTTIEQYGYDGLYRLKSVSDAASANIESYTYDATGDRLSKTIAVQAAQAYVYDPASHHLTSVNGTPRTYDDVGNTETDGTGLSGRTYTYDDRNRLVAARTSAFTQLNSQYNGRGERVSKTFGATTTLFLYDEAGMLLSEYTSGGTPLRTYLYADTTPVAMIDGPGTFEYVHTDQLGTPRAITSTTGAVIWVWDFEGNPFGEAASANDPDGNGVNLIQSLRFPGQYFDTETGLNYNYFREYEPSTGRYVESDRIGLSGGISTYSYVSGSPSMLTDRLGLSASCGDCCANVPWRSGSGDFAGGTTLCCEGVPTVCLNPQICEGRDRSGKPVAYPADACAIVRGCARVHERVHTHQVTCSGGPGSPPYAPPGVPECHAWGRESFCLNISMCGSKICEDIVRQIQEFKAIRRDTFCFSVGT
jgi:RHS repeat-associated protein